MTQELYRVLRKTQLELEKANKKLNEFEYMINVKPATDKQILQRELAHHIAKYEELYRETQTSNKPIETNNAYCQTVFWTQNAESSTENITVSDKLVETVEKLTSESQVQSQPEIMNAECQIEPILKGQITQTIHSQDLEPPLHFNLPNIQKPLEIQFDIKKFSKNTIIEYEIVIGNLELNTE
eukprot:NODE_173_length_14219_cov_0.603824.p8 type:complete len:183 gc:universal NODE_173_length_14219_cov_0.603824:9542-10090(+)